MKNRHFTIIILGLLLILTTWLSKYQNNILTVMIWGVLIVIGIVSFLVTLYRNIFRYIKERLFNFFTTYLILGFAIILCAMEYKIQSDFNKPSLLKVFYDGDFNGTGIDFKEDGTYIFDNSAIGMSNYTYGTYKISGKKIILDKNSIEKVIVTDQLEIRMKDSKHIDGIETDNYVYQIDKNGNIMVDETIFRLVIDNRKQPFKLKEVN